MEELLYCANEHIASLFGNTPQKDLLVSVYMYVLSADEPKQRISEIKRCVALNDYVGFNNKMSNSNVKGMYKKSIRDHCLKDEFIELGKDMTLLFADWRNKWRKNQ